MDQIPNVIMTEHVRLIFTRLPAFMELTWEKVACKQFIHYLQYGHVQTIVTKDELHIDVYDLQDRMPSTQFLNWFSRYQTHIHPDSLEMDATADVYHIITDSTGLLVESAEKLTDIYPIITTAKLCDPPTCTKSRDQHPMVKIRLSFRIKRIQSPIVMCEATELLQRYCFPDTLNIMSVTPVCWNDSRLTSLGDSNYAPIKFPPELGSMKVWEGDLSCHHRDWTPDSESKNTK